jgi:MFS superfamily sulfate permease-like transporter
MVLGVLATAGVVASMFLSWRSGGVEPGDVPLGFLFDSTTTATSPSLLLALIPLAVVLAVGSLMPRASGARIVAALGTIAVVVLFAVQLHSVTDRVPGASMWDALETGWYVAAIASVVGLVSGFMPSGWARRRATVAELDDGGAADFYDRRYR